MQIFDFGPVIFGSPDFVREHPSQAVNRLPFPCRHLRWMDLMLGRNLLRRLVSPQRLKRYSSFEFVLKTASLRHLCIRSSRLDSS